MSTLQKITMPISCVDMNGENPLPLFWTMGVKPRFFSPENLAEDDELFLNHHTVCSTFPYRAQDEYTHALTHTGLPAVVLENEYLRATFTPTVGGKLWSLYDKKAERELLFANPVFRPAYLALRNAWTSGGVEWNCGATIGHHPHTTDTMFTVLIDEKESGIGCPVLRMYHFERIRAVTQQMDFYLPDGSPYLHCRMRIVNDAYTETPMYWWSNIAVESDPTARNVVPADYAFTNSISVSAIKSDKVIVDRVAIPYRNGIDISYPTRNPKPKDYFFKTYPDRRHYTAHLDKDGYGLVETSTARLKGRKLFVWGQGNGGINFQEFLAGDDGQGHYSNGQYCEIQCGLAASQYEAIPMPAKTAWEFIEYYGPLKADPTLVHGEWHTAQAEVEACLDAVAPLADMEKELRDTHKMATSALGEVLYYGDGFAALENLRREKADMQPLCPHLDFGKVGESEAMWVALLKNGSLRCGDNENSELPPASFQRRPEWRSLLQAAADGPDRHFWPTHYHLGCAYLADRMLAEAERELELSCRLNTNAWNLQAIAELYRLQGKADLYAMTALAAARTLPSVDALVKNAMLALYRTKKWREIYELAQELTAHQRALPRVKLYYATACAELDKLEEAEAILYENGALIVDDIQEEERTIGNLWLLVEGKKAARDGRPFDPETAEIPLVFSFAD